MVGMIRGLALVGLACSGLFVCVLSLVVRAWPLHTGAVGTGDENK